MKREGRENIYNSDNESLGIFPRFNRALHIKEDIKYINSLSYNDLSKLVPIEKSGLYKYLKVNLT